jgi:hypothetical protein
VASFVFVAGLADSLLRQIPQRDAHAIVLGISSSPAHFQHLFPRCRNANFWLQLA